MVDFHAHSTASDGTLTPTALAELAHARGLSALTLTDHDTVAGLDEAQRACRERGLLFLGGIELEIAWESGEFHLLGLGLRQWTSGWVNTLQDLQRLRAERNHKIFDLMQQAGITGGYDQVERLAQGGQVGRPHFARFLVERGKVDSVQDAFTHFLGRGRQFHVPRAGLKLTSAIATLHEAGALAVVAHPKTLQVSMPHLGQLMHDWKALGMDGVEAWHPSAEPRVARRIEAMAGSAGLKVSAGSDFHGATRPDRNLGLTSGGVPIDAEYLERLFPDAASRFA
jgi:predicted metal-dependent phosphoesterase TrpH